VRNDRAFHGILTARFIRLQIEFHVKEFWYIIQLDVCMYMYVCMYVYIYIHTYIHIYIHTHIHTHTHTHTHAHTNSNMVRTTDKIM
jgi:uncharacterized membrane protein YcgQ (UPF0703/DUF1980 family)